MQESLLMSGQDLQPVNEGDILDGKYRVDKVLGIGGMGVVVAATHLQLEQRVAIKYLLPSALEHPEIIERFGREARAAAKVHGQHVVRVIDVGRLPDGRHYMVMEHLSGEDLEEVLRTRVKLPVVEAIGYVLQACEAVAQAHMAGIVHRDLKPANLFLATTPDHRTVVKVLDFGISKVAGDKSITKTATAMGTAHYMSPEQLMSSKDVDERTDIWALGVILFELITGEKPFEGDALPEIVAKILSNQRAPMAELAPDVPEQLEAIVGRALTTLRTERYSSIAALAEAIGPFASDEQRASVARIARIQGVERKSATSTRPASTLSSRMQAYPNVDAPEGRAENPTVRFADAAGNGAGSAVRAASPLAATEIGVTSGVGATAEKPRKATRAGVAAAAILVVAGAAVFGITQARTRLSANAASSQTIAADPGPASATASSPKTAVPNSSAAVVIASPSATSNGETASTLALLPIASTTATARPLPNLGALGAHTAPKSTAKAIQSAPTTRPTALPVPPTSTARAPIGPSAPTTVATAPPAPSAASTVRFNQVPQ
jgi:eukaryotic-like serine/threonine-protein kinase